MRPSHALLAGGLAGALVALDLPLCPAALLLGVPCPGCGLTRGTLALLRGDIAAATAWHPLTPVVLSAGLVAVGRVACPGFLRGARAERWLTWAAGVLLLCLASVWAARFLGFFGGPVSIEGPIWRLVP